MMNRSILLLASVGLAAFATAASGQNQPNLFTNPSFDQGACAQGWTVARVDAPNVCAQDAGTVWLNYNNEGEDPNVSQTVTGLTVGQTYVVTAQWRPGPTAATYAPGQREIFAIGIDGSWEGMSYAGDGSGLTTSTREFIARSTQATIAFAGEYGSDGDVVLTAVSLSATGAADTGDESYLTNATVQTSATAPATMSGPTQIGIRWDMPACPGIDVDLYVSQDASAPYLFFNNTVADWGTFGEDIRTSGGLSYEEVTLHNVPDIRNMRVMLNHYSGTCAQPITGEIRARFNGQVYSTPFTLTGGPNNAAGQPDFRAALNGTSTNASWSAMNPALLFNLR